jgi:hypothetical protein
VSTTIDVPGGTAAIRDELVTERQFRVIESAMVAAAPGFVKGGDIPDVPEDGTDEEKATVQAERVKAVMAISHTLDEASAMLVVRDARIVAFLESWTLKDATGKPRPLPTLDTVQDLERPLYAALVAATAEKSIDLGVASFAVNPDPASPTNGSSSSNGQSKDAAEPTPIPTSPESGASIASGSAIPA